MHVPSGTVVVRPRDKPWMNSEIRRAVRRRNRLLKIFCQNKLPENWEVYRLQRNFTTSLTGRHKLQDPLLGAKKWWGLIKQFYGNTIQTTVPSLLGGDCLVTDSKDKAILLNDYFSSQSIYLPNPDAPLPNLIEFHNAKDVIGGFYYR